MCRALKVLCVAPDREELDALKRAAVSADWELTSGATTEAEALEQLEGEHPHVVVVAGGFDAFVRDARSRYPFLRIVADHPLSEASFVFDDLDRLREAIKGLPPPAGPVA
jgi:hypothetical protein